MDHRPFEDWLLEDKVLAPDEKRQMDLHLKECSPCTTLAEVGLALKSVRTAEPAAGFTDRFQVRLAARKIAIRRRNFWGYAILAASILGALIWLAWPLLRSLVQSPVEALASWFASLLSSWAAFQAMLHAGMALFKVVPSFVPAYLWIVLLLAAGGWSLLWVFSLVKFTKIPRGV
jgi:hypothetical protein